MPSLKLTKRTLDGARPGAAEYFVWDTEITGFGARVHPTGRTTFVYKCRPAGGRQSGQRKITIGEYGPITVDQARRQAQQLAGQVAAGNDPGIARRTRRAISLATREAATVADLAPEYFMWAEAHLAERTVRDYRSMWKRRVLPHLGRLKVAEVTDDHVRQLHTSLSAHKFAANRVLSLIGSFFTWAELGKHRPRRSNPTQDVAAYPEEARERYLTLAELDRLGGALRLALGDGIPPAPNRRRVPKTGETAKHRPKSADAPRKANPTAVAALYFLLLSGWREMEVLSLRWSDLHFDAYSPDESFAVLPSTKTGRSRRKLSQDAWRLLSGMPRVEGHDYVFPGQKPATHLKEINRVWYAVRDVARLPDVRLHDLRHTFGGVMGSEGESLLVIGKALGHGNSATTERYAHIVDLSVQRAVNAAGKRIAARILPASASEAGSALLRLKSS